MLHNEERIGLVKLLLIWVVEVVVTLAGLFTTEYNIKPRSEYYTF